ncbi:MAG: hypothetical protein R2708_23960 [Vicinamibacterales bacterium]
MKAHHSRADEIWLKIHKKGSGLPSITAAQALDVALCWGWIDGIRKSYDERSFLQRYTPRRPRSLWSQINREHVARLTAAGRMTPHGHARSMPPRPTAGGPTPTRRSPPPATPRCRPTCWPRSTPARGPAARSRRSAG